MFFNNIVSRIRMPRSTALRVAVVVLFVLGVAALAGAELALSKATALLTRIGGLLLATIGTQMLLGGLKEFFA